MAIIDRLKSVYNPDEAEICYLKIQELIDRYQDEVDSKKYKLSERDAILITYGDQLHGEGKSPLQHLKSFLDENVGDCINSVHLLPFYPYTSDDGFSVVDYKAVNPDCGNWDDVTALGQSRRLMFDAVVNHMSQASDWFQGYMKDEEAFKEFFLDIDPETDLSSVTRPRALPLLTKFTTAEGVDRHIWTTFSADQVDLNVKNYRVLIALLDVLLFYASKGAKLIRLDAIAFLWKEIGTTCLHLDQTHEIIKLMRDVLCQVAPELIIITETNVPHEENISYFGNGEDESHMVYNFSLPPLVAHSLLTQNTKTITEWAQSLELPTNKVCFFNFTASHDGIGVRPATGILSDDEIKNLVKVAQLHGGHVSFKDNGDGTESPYELNCNYADMLTPANASTQERAARMILAQAIMIAMPGVPGIYFHSLVGSRNYNEGVEQTGRNRTINREKNDVEPLLNEISEQGSMRQLIFSQMKQLLNIRKNHSAFNPYGEFAFHDLGDCVFAIERKASAEEDSGILAIHNVTDQDQEFTMPSGFSTAGVELISNDNWQGKVHTLKPYQVAWFKAS